MNWAIKARQVAKDGKTIVKLAEEELPARFKDDLDEVYRSAEILEKLADEWESEHPLVNCPKCGGQDVDACYRCCGKGTVRR